MCTKWGKWVYGRRANIKVILTLAKGFAGEQHVETVKGIVKLAKKMCFFCQFVKKFL